MTFQSLATFAAKTPTRDPRRDIQIGAGIAFLFFVVILGWAALTPLDAAVRASGRIAVVGNIQAVQHPTGGVVTAIHVREGQQVKAGDLLIEIAAPEIQAVERSLTSDYFNLLAQRERLRAEIVGKSSFDPPPEFSTLKSQDNLLAQRAYRLQLGEMRARATSLAAEQAVLAQRANQLRQQQIGARKQQESYSEQQRLLRDELVGMREIQKKGFAGLNRIRALERAEADLVGREGAMVADIARAGEAIGETRSQSLALLRARQEQIASDLRETDAKISEVLPRLVSAREQLGRARLSAPASGRVVGLSVFTLGGVVGPGQVIMSIVPRNRNLVVQAQIAPVDADDVYEGQPAELRLASITDRNFSPLEGRVKTVSADSFTDEQTGQAYFTAEIEVDTSEIQKLRRLLGKGEVRAGLPMEVMLSVRKRTALEYFLEPLSRTFRNSLHEQ